MNTHVRSPLVPAHVANLGPAETQALEYLQRAIRQRKSPSAHDVAKHLNNDSSAYGGQVIESLISKGYLSRQYTVLLPLDYVE